MNNFFITGLPRSRTAWLAAFMSSLDGVLCYHERLKDCADIEEYWRAMSVKGYEFVGNADCGIPMVTGSSHSKVVIIERDPDEVIDSLSRLFGDSFMFIPELVMEAKRALDKMKGMRVDYRQIDNALNDIVRYCTGMELEQSRADVFLNMNIQTNDFSVNPEALKMLEVSECLG